MLIFKIAAFGIIAAFCALALKEQRNDFAVLLTVAAGLIIFIMISDSAAGIISQLTGTLDKFGITLAPIKYVIKIVGLGLIGDFSSSIIEECGQKSLSDKISLVTKIIIIIQIIPLIGELLGIVQKILQ